MLLHKDKVYEDDRVYWEPKGGQADTNGTVINTDNNEITVTFDGNKGTYRFTSNGQVVGSVAKYGHHMHSQLKWWNTHKVAIAGRDGKLYLENVTLDGAKRG